MAARSVTIELEVRGKQARAALEGIESGATQLRQIVDDPMQLRFDADRARAALESVESGVTDLQRTAQQAASVTNRSTNEMASGFNRASQNVGGTTTAVTNLNRIVQDAPFGVMGVANNIEPFIQSFQNMGDEATTTGQKMKQLISGAFTGPGALITIVSLVTAALSAIQMGIIDLGDDSENTEKELKGLLDAAKNLNDVFDADFGLADRIQSEIDANKEAIRLAKERARLEERIGSFESSRPSLSESQLEQLPQMKQRSKALKELITLYGFENTELTKLEENLEKLQLKQEAFNGKIGTSEQKLAAFVDSIESDADQAMNRFQAGLVGGEQAVENQIDSLETIISTYKGAAEAGEDQYIPVIIQLQKKVEELRKELGNKTSNDGFVEQQIRNYEYLDQLLNGVIEKTKGQKLTAEARLGTFEALQQPDTQAIDADINTNIGGYEPPEGSIAAKKQELKELQWMYENTPFGEARKELSKQIKQVKNDIDEMGGSLEAAGDEGDAALRALHQTTMMVANGLAQAAIRGEDLDGVLKSILAQLGSKAFVTALSFLLPGGPAIKEASFFGQMFGFAGGTDMGFPGIGKVGERGEELLVAPPMSSIITNENIEKMSRMKKEARQATTIAANIDSTKLVNEIRGLRNDIQNMPPPEVDLNKLDYELTDNQQIESQIGNS